MGIKRPDPTKKEGKNNNAKMTYTKMVRDELLNICIAHGIDIETEVKDGNAKHLQPAEYKLKKVKEEIEEIYRVMTEQELKNKELEQQIKHSSSELEHLTDRLNVLREDNTKAKSEYQMLHDQLQTTMNAVKEAERTKRTITEKNKELTEENKELTEVLDTQRELLNQAKEVVRAVENFTYGYDSEFTNAKTLLDRFFVDYKKKNGIDLSQQFNSFVDHDKKLTDDINRMLRNLDIDTSQTDDGYNY